MTSRAGAVAVLLLAAWWLLASMPAQAQDWLLNSHITQRGTYNSNLLLNPNNKVSTFGSLTIPAFKLQRSSPTSTVTIDGQLKFAEFINHSELNADAQLLDLTANKELSERSSLGFTGSFARDTTTTSEQDISGRFLSSTIRFTKWDASPSWTYQLSPIETLTMSGNYEQKVYEGSQKTDYRYYGPTLQYDRQISELAAVFGSARYTRYQTLGSTDFTSNTYGGLLGYKYTPTERFSVTAAAGLDYRTSAGGSTGGKGEVGYRLNIDMGYQLDEQTKVNLTISHDTEASGDRQQVVRTRGSLRVAYDLNELTRLTLNADYADNQDYFGSGSGSESSEGLSRYYSLRPALAYSITDDLNVSLSYQFRYKVFESQNQGSVTDHGAFLTFTYDLPDQSWSGF